MVLLFEDELTYPRYLKILAGRRDYFGIRPGVRSPPETLGLGIWYTLGTAVCPNCISWQASDLVVPGMYIPPHLRDLCIK